VLRSSSYLVIIAAGQMLVLIVGGFDLSQGAVVALTSVSSALVMVAFKDTFAGEPGLIILVGVLAGLGCGAVVGLVNGACVAFLRISPFMVTLGTMSTKRTQASGRSNCFKTRAHSPVSFLTSGFPGWMASRYWRPFEPSPDGNGSRS